MGSNSYHGFMGNDKCQEAKGNSSYHWAIVIYCYDGAIGNNCYHEFMVNK